ncbi:MAG: homoaconitase [Planctomycetota bacterium]|nr:MAG: homoaconitase [Planctomycetota bacterium]
MPQTAIEKIVQRYASGIAPGAEVRAGDFVRIRPKHVMTHDNTGAVIPKFLSIFRTETGQTPTPPTVADPRQPVFAMDHDVQNTSPENLGKYAKIEAFAREHGIDYYPPGRGIAHQVMVEEGYVTPGSLVVGSDSHSNLYGAVAAVGTPVVRTDAAAIWATGETWWQVPEIARVELTGSLPPGATGKDVIVTLCGHFNHDEVLNCAVEFTGDGVAALSVEQRMTIANMTTEWGALVGMFPFDERLRDFLLERADEFEARRGTGASPAEPRYTAADVRSWWAERAAVGPDEGAFYSRELSLDLSSVSPHVSGPDSVKTMAPISKFDAEPVAIHKAYLMSCVNARLEDLAEAAAVVRGRRVAPGVGFYLAPASSRVKADAERLGYWGDLLEAGAIELPPGCGACIGLGRGTLEAGEVGVSATNRNFKGRMGSRDAKCYLASPAVVAASAVAGRICGPDALDREPGGAAAAPAPVRGSGRVNPSPPRAGTRVAIREGFPARLAGRALLLPADNLNTDGIYGKDVTYRDDITPEQQGRYAMLNYDPEFQRLAEPGDIIVAGRNFGTGSSREQAATALASFGIRCVVAASFSQTYARNAYNNGFICLACPGLVDALFARLADRRDAGALTIPGPEIELDFEASVARLGDEAFGFPPLSPVAQELVAMGGAEAVVRRRMTA